MSFEADNDLDGLVDCDDPDREPYCGGVDLYGIFDPPTETACTDGVHDDADGLTDCLDSDCADDPPCVDDALYGVPGLPDADP